MAFCGKCGAEVSDEDLFCTACGNPTKAEVPIQTDSSLSNRTPIALTFPKVETKPRIVTWTVISSTLLIAAIVLVITLTNRHQAGSTSSPSYVAGWNWVANGYPGSNNSICSESTQVLSNASNCNQTTSDPCNSQASLQAGAAYTVSQWVDGCYKAYIQQATSPIN